MSESSDIHRRLRRRIAPEGPGAAHPEPSGEESGSELDDLKRALRQRRSKPASPSVPAERAGESGGKGGIIYRRDIPSTPEHPRRAFVPPGKPVDLAEATGGREVTVREHGRAWVIDTPAGSVDGAADLDDRLGQAWSPRAGAVAGWLEHYQVPSIDMDGVVFFDLETTGLGSTPLFLIGAMFAEAGRLVVRQFFARNYAEERAVLAMFHELLDGRGMLVSFNGKSFDMPYVRTRSAAVGLPAPRELPHLDLLHVGRRAWKRTLPNCKLQTIERVVCRRMRFGDIPGSQIPDAYHGYVHTGNAAVMVDVLKHNLLDLVTLADICTHLPPPGS